jgi:predicted Fe-Mo cluster-binding NifX family protein
MTLKIALATDNGIEFADKHFGEAAEYNIYIIDKNNARYIKTIVNNSLKEKMHADPAKARSIIKILKEEDVQIAVNTEFGPNIKRVKKQIVPVLIKERKLKEALKILVENYSLLLASWEEGENRKAVYI